MRAFRLFVRADNTAILASAARRHGNLIANAVTEVMNPRLRISISGSNPISTAETKSVDSYFYCGTTLAPLLANPSKPFCFHDCSLWCCREFELIGAECTKVTNDVRWPSAQPN